MPQQNAEVGRADLIDDTMTALAQGVINIAEGHTTIEPESLVHRAMALTVQLYQEGKLVPSACLEELALSLEHGHHPLQRAAGAELRKRLKVAP